MGSPNMSVELKDRNVSTDFINNFNEKLVYVGDLNKFSEEFEKITKRSRRKWKYIDLTNMTISRWNMTQMPRMIYLHTLILDSCCLETKDLGFIGRTLTVKTLSLNKNKFQDYKTTLNILSNCFPLISFLSLFGNPFYWELNDDDDFYTYRSFAASKNKYLRFLDGAPLSTKFPTEFAMEAFDETDFSAREKHNYERASNSDHGECSGNSSFYRKVKYRYRGQRSEGNRYIQNVQL